MSQNLIFPRNAIIIFLYISSFQDGLNDLSIPYGCLFIVNNVRGGISKCIKQRCGKLLRLCRKLRLQFLFIYTHLWPRFSFYINLCPLTRIFSTTKNFGQFGHFEFGKKNSKLPNFGQILVQIGRNLFFRKDLS